MGDEVSLLSTGALEIWSLSMALGFGFSYDSMVSD